ncbi:MAG: hypothetical protein ACLGIR_03810 [Actinomycetes bacterium]
MNAALVVLLVLLWAIALLPGALRSRRSNARATVGGFERAMDVLRERPSGREILVPANAERLAEPHPLHHLGVGWGDPEPVPPAEAPAPTPAPAAPAAVPGRGGRRQAAIVEARRRRFTTLLGATGSMLLLAAVTGWAALWVLAVGTVVATVGYAALLRRLKLQRDEARAVVRRIHPVAPVERPGDLADPRDDVVVDLHAARVPVAVGGSLQVATRPDQPWTPQAGVRIRRWEA